MSIELKVWFITFHSEAWYLLIMVTNAYEGLSQNLRLPIDFDDLM